MQTLNWCDRTSRLIKSPSASLSAAISPKLHHAQTFSSATIRQSIGNASTGAAAACAANSATTSPPKGTSQQIAKSQASTSSDLNDGTDNSITSPTKTVMPTVQKSPSESINSKTDTDKKCGGKSRNKEGTIKATPL